MLYYRALLKITQRELSARSGVNIRQIQRYESSASCLGNMTLRNAISISKVLGITPEQLYKNNNGGQKNEENYCRKTTK